MLWENLKNYTVVQSYTHHLNFTSDLLPIFLNLYPSFIYQYIFFFLMNFKVSYRIQYVSCLNTSGYM